MKLIMSGVVISLILGTNFCKQPKVKNSQSVASNDTIPSNDNGLDFFLYDTTTVHGAFQYRMAQDSVLENIYLKLLYSNQNNDEISAVKFAKILNEYDTLNDLGFLQLAKYYEDIYLDSAILYLKKAISNTRNDNSDNIRYSSSGLYIFLSILFDKKGDKESALEAINNEIVYCQQRHRVYQFKRYKIFWCLLNQREKEAEIQIDELNNTFTFDTYYMDKMLFYLLSDTTKYRELLPEIKIDKFIEGYIIANQALLYARSGQFDTAESYLKKSKIEDSYYGFIKSEIIREKYGIEKSCNYLLNYNIMEDNYSDLIIIARNRCED